MKNDSKAYIDTSLLVAYYYPEALSHKVEELLGSVESIHISFLTEVEFASAISKKVRMQSISKMTGRTITQEFQKHLKQSYFQWIPLESIHYEMAKSWIGSCESPLRTLDALHLATSWMSEVPLYTADQHLATSAQKLSIQSHFVCV